MEVKIWFMRQYVQEIVGWFIYQLVQFFWSMVFFIVEVGFFFVVDVLDLGFVS